MVTVTTASMKPSRCAVWVVKLWIVWIGSG
jgi:hypothetical protein